MDIVSLCNDNEKCEKCVELNVRALYKQLIRNFKKVYFKYFAGVKVICIYVK